MKKVAIENLPVNSFIDKPVYLDEKYILLSPDTKIRQQLINRLKLWQFPSVLSDGSPVSTPSFDMGSSSGSTLDQALMESEQNEEAIEFIQKVISVMEEVFQRFKEKNEIRIDAIVDIVKQMIQMLKSHRKNMEGYIYSNDEGVDYQIIHSIKTSILALSIAEFLKMPPFKLLDMGTSAMLHRIGMLKLPANVYKKDANLSTDERRAIFTHPVLAFKNLKSMNFPPAVCLAVLEQNERIDGSGYPRKLKGDQISLFGKILGVATSYCAAVSDRPFRDSMDGHSGIMEMVRDMGKRYDETILRALVYILSVYPIGTFVELTNGAKGFVVKTNQENPKFPDIKLLLDENGNVYPNQPIVTIQEGNDIQIARTLPEEQIAAIKDKVEKS